MSERPAASTQRRDTGALFYASIRSASSSIGILLLWICLYIFSDPSTHLGSFFGNAIADWSGVVVTVLATKFLYEKGSKESRKPPKDCDEQRVGENSRSTR